MSQNEASSSQTILYMIVVLTFIINLLAPITNLLGALGACYAIMNEDWNVLILAGVFAVVGLVFGIFAYGLGIPPRWFWALSINEIFSFAVTAVIGYAGIFAAWPCAWYLVQELLPLFTIA